MPIISSPPCAAALVADPLRGRRLEVQRGPHELVVGEVELDPVLRQHVVADDAVQLDAGQAHAVHALELEQVDGHARAASSI